MVKNWVMTKLVIKQPTQSYYIKNNKEVCTYKRVKNHNRIKLFYFYE